MAYLILAIIFVLIGIFIPRLIPKTRAVAVMDEQGLSRGGGTPRLSWSKGVLRYGSLLIALFLVFATSYVIIDADSIGHLKRIYLGKSMPPGRG
jgi:hypothetical protein